MDFHMRLFFEGSFARSPSSALLRFLFWREGSPTIN